MKNNFPLAQFKLDNTGKSPALFSNKEIPKIDDKILSKLKIFSKNNDNCNVRICLHKSKKKNLHSMIVLLNKKNKSIIHVHKDIDEVYQILEGKLKINVFKKKKKITSYILSKKRNLIFRMNSGIVHQTQPLTSFVIFSENRSKSKLR